MKFRKSYRYIDLLAVAWQCSPLSYLAVILQKIIVSIVSVLMIPAFSGFIDASLQSIGQRSAKVMLALCWIIALLAVSLLLGTLFGFIQKKFMIRLNKQIDLACVERQSALQYSCMEEQEKLMTTQRVMERLAGNVSSALNSFFRMLEVVFRLLSMFVLLLGYGMWWIAALFLALALLICLVSYRSSRKVYELYREYYPGDVELYQASSILRERYTVHERALFGYTQKMNEIWYEKQRALNRKKMIAKRRIILLQSASKLLFVFATVLILGCLFVWNSRGKLSTGSFIALLDGVIVLANFIMDNSIALAGELADLEGFRKELNEFCAYPYDAGVLAAAGAFGGSLESLEFRNVTFSYPGTERIILKDFSCRMEGGRRYAFVGENGCGKTTVVKLLSGLYDDYSGEILVNGRNIKELEQSERKALFAVLYQDFARYEIPLVENITLGRELNRDRLDGLYRDMELGSLLERLPEGENTLLGKLEESGQDISGGEWQRLALARLLYSDSPFLIMDEPTAALDPVSESRLYELFQRISRDRTSLLITHRLGSIKTVDYIFLLKDGKVREEGTHEELMNAKGIYADMYREQRSWYQ